MVKKQEPEPSRPDSRSAQVWPVVRSTLELATLVAACLQREDLAVVAKVLAVLGQLATVMFCGRERR
ncbi:hypothetical protein [Micromonospora sp. WMMD980]|uniref:hypothetical protein n=1 Tax=Micromonospora sp. WMMD980 TaxID=3016088 RepID=UPI002415A6E2|nr:hypothetical protein [Micromonospora sp. WMMD980]MDG4803708.1 hypothetical protein [Micromonospora sp. WMMD980]